MPQFFYLLYYLTRIDFAAEVFLATTFVLPHLSSTSIMDNRNQGSLFNPDLKKWTRMCSYFSVTSIPETLVYIS